MARAPPAERASRPAVRQGHRRFCTQLSTAAPPRVHLREDTELSEDDGGAKVSVPLGMGVRVPVGG